jgi:hypothetical protein
VVVAGLVLLVLLQDHLIGDFTATVNVVPRSYRIWRDPVAVLCAFVSFAVAARIAGGRPHRLQVAFVVWGCTLAAAIYSHQEGFHFACPPGYHCIEFPLRAELLHDSRSLLIMALGFAVGVVLMLPRRWIVTPLLHPRRG